MKLGENDRRLLLLVCVVLLALLAGGSRHSAPGGNVMTPPQRVAAELGSGVVGVSGAEWRAAARENPFWLIEISQGR